MRISNCAGHVTLRNRTILLSKSIFLFNAFISKDFINSWLKVTNTKDYMLFVEAAKK